MSASFTGNSVQQGPLPNSQPLGFARQEMAFSPSPIVLGGYPYDPSFNSSFSIPSPTFSSPAVGQGQWRLQVVESDPGFSDVSPEDFHQPFRVRTPPTPTSRMLFRPGDNYEPPEGCLDGLGPKIPELPRALDFTNSPLLSSHDQDVTPPYSDWPSQSMFPRDPSAYGPNPFQDQALQVSNRPARRRSRASNSTGDFYSLEHQSKKARSSSKR